MSDHKDTTHTDHAERAEVDVASVQSGDSADEVESKVMGLTRATGPSPEDTEEGAQAPNQVAE